MRIRRRKVRSIIKGVVPKPVRPILRRFYYIFHRLVGHKIIRIFHFIQDSIELLSGKRDRLTPPEWMIFVGGGDFKTIGEEFVNYFVEPGGLKWGDRVLDVGCGIGRMAVPLTHYLKNGGSYDGIDIVRQGIKWCGKKITSRYPNFRFHLADIFNCAYNPTGKIIAAEYQFPFQDESFNFIFLTSVFTHMLPQDMEHYFSEINRLLNAGGRCFITFFLLNDESLKMMDAGKSSLDFKFCLDTCRIKDEDVPEAAVAYYEKYIRELFDTHNLNILAPIRYGSWCGREYFLSYQDIIIAVKRPENPGRYKCLPG